ncbi:hypothetical protein JCM10049v2_003059 [Rhodotorula toruloides]
MTDSPAVQTPGSKVYAGPNGEELMPKMSDTYNEDIVQWTDADGTVKTAVVTRCWADEQNPETASEAQRLNIPFDPLKPGYLEVLHPDGSRTEILESTVTVVDRGLLFGDVVRPRRPHGTPATTRPKGPLGQIADMKTEVQLQRILTGEFLDGWFDTDELVAAARMNRGDHVVSGDWIGVVEEVFEMAHIEAGNAGLVRRVCDIAGSLSVGPAAESVKQMLLDRGEGFLASLLGASDLKTILDVKQCMVAVNWLCRNPQAASTGADSEWQRPKRYWTDIDQLIQVHATADHLHTVHDKVVFKDPSRFPCPSSRWSSTYPEGHRVFVITNARTTATVVWQDGSRTTHSTAELEQVAQLDEDADIFPGDIGVFSGAEPNKVGVVQAVDARKRTIRLRWLDLNDPKHKPVEGEEGEETVSGLEFDPHGPPPDAYGVRKGDLVLIQKVGETNGAVFPTVPGLGESEVAAGLMPGGEDLRMEISTLGLSYAQTLSDSFIPPKPQTAPDSLTWYGEVRDLLLDGRVLVRHPSGSSGTYETDRLTQLVDGMDPAGEAAAGLQALVDEEGMMLDEDGEDEEEGVETDGSWMTEDEDMGSEEEEAGEPAVVSCTIDDFAGDWSSQDDSQDEDYKADDDEEASVGGKKGSDVEMKGWADEEEEEANKVASDAEVEMNLLPPKASTSTAADNGAPGVDATATPAASAAATVSMPGEIEDFDDWKRFEVLEEAPADHHYINEKVDAPGKAFMSRVRKEHQVLASSLPPNILVRAYENRTDLLRCLIIGPTDTPFANAPFLFDVYLSPTKFPHEPPQVFFHSWASGVRVSPNLYVEGKVCLSLLGTWSGDKTENWSSARSSILQVFVSIQALIMVENPYYTEPGYEKQMGTTDGTAASELYNERTLVLTRAFVKRACEYPPMNFSREIAAYYYNGFPGSEQAGGALQGIIEQSRLLLEESERWHAEQDKREGAEDAAEDVRQPPKSGVVPSQRILTEGAGLSLRRTLKALEDLQKRGPKLDEPQAA